MNEREKVDDCHRWRVLNIPFNVSAAQPSNEIQNLFVKWAFSTDVDHQSATPAQMTVWQFALQCWQPSWTSFFFATVFVAVYLRSKDTKTKSKVIKCSSATENQSNQWNALRKCRRSALCWTFWVKTWNFRWKYDWKKCCSVRMEEGYDDTWNTAVIAHRLRGLVGVGKCIETWTFDETIASNSLEFTEKCNWQIVFGVIFAVKTSADVHWMFTCHRMSWAAAVPCIEIELNLFVVFYEFC